jgi:signal transduction histidine kinase
MTSHQNTDSTLTSMTIVRVWSTAGTSAAYITILIGYLITVLTTAPNLTLVNFMAFTVLQVVYFAVLWWFYKNEFSENLRENLRIIAIVMLTLLTVVTGLLSFSGLQWDWLLYIVTISVYFLCLSLRVAVISGVLLYVLLVLNLGFLNNWNWSHLSISLLSLFPAFVFVAVFSLTYRILDIQKERAERLLRHLEESNAELEEAHRQLQSYAHEVEELTIVRERTRMAREIHDTLGHYLSILTIQLETISKLQERDPARAAIEVAEARRVASQSMQEVRNAIAALRPTSIATLSLTQAISQLGSEFEQSATETTLTLDLDTQLPPISPDLQVSLYRAVQEALTNVRRHAHASKVLVRLRYEDGLLELVVLDNGSGASSDDTDNQSDGFGLIGIRERIELLGGQVTYSPTEQTGYRVTIKVRVPLFPTPVEISKAVTLGDKEEDRSHEPAHSRTDC